MCQCEGGGGFPVCYSTRRRERLSSKARKDRAGDVCKVKHNMGKELEEKIPSCADWITLF